MTATFEISLYPLNNEYVASVLAFLEELRSLRNVEIQTNGMSTILIGDYASMWVQLGALMENSFNKEDAVLVMKVAKGRREFVE